VQRGRVGPAVRGRDPDGDLLGRGLGVFDQDVEPAIVGEDAGIEEFVLRPLPLPPLVLGHQLLVGKRPLRVAVPQAHEGVGGGIVDVEVILLHVLAVVALEGGDAEQPLLEMRITFIPEGRREAKQLKPVADARDAILPPAVGLGAGHAIREMPPGVAVRGIVFPDRAPGPVREIRPPPPPAVGVVGDCQEPVGFGIREVWWHGHPGRWCGHERVRVVPQEMVAQDRWQKQGKPAAGIRSSARIT
jgi:hypothetical protein